MSVLFKRILIPVDFSINTELAVQNAIDINGREEMAIDLFHLESRFSSLETALELQKLKKTIKKRWPMVEVSVHVGSGTSVPVGIIGMAHLLSPDLIVIGKHGNGLHFPLFNIITPRYLARRTNVPVLTVKPGSLNTGIKVIVILAGNFVSERELKIAIMISQRNHAVVHLITTHKILSSPAFVNTYNRLCGILQQQVPCLSLGKKYIIRGALNYARSVMADLILINPLIKDSISPFQLYVDISSRIERDSRIQILECI
jgi:nucleotide-binding universal stress UspA family protein